MGAGGATVVGTLRWGRWGGNVGCPSAVGGLGTRSALGQGRQGGISPALGKPQLLPSLLSLCPCCPPGPDPQPAPDPLAAGGFPSAFLSGRPRDIPHCRGFPTWRLCLGWCERPCVPMDAIHPSFSMHLQTHGYPHPLLPSPLVLHGAEPFQNWALHSWGAHGAAVLALGGVPPRHCPSPPCDGSTSSEVPAPQP